MARGWLMMVALGALGSSLGGCAGDPKDIGLTGPYPDGVAAVTLSRPVARSDISADTPGVKSTALDHYAPSARASPGAPGQRYYGYNY